MSYKVLLKSVRLRTGHSVGAPPLSVPAASVNVFVGPNHSGKSALLQELESVVENPAPQATWKLLSEVEFVPWTPEDRTATTSWLRNQAKEQPLDRPPGVQISSGKTSWSFPKTHFEQALAGIATTQDIGGSGRLRKLLLSGRFFRLGGQERLSLLDPTERRPPTRRSADLLSRLFYSDLHRRSVQSIVYEAFGCWLVIDPFDQNFKVKLSAEEPIIERERSLGDEAVKLFEHAADMSTMSDGVRAFSGMVAAVVASEADVILIDEPEAFLHPALCTKLARELCRLARKNRQQLFIATHSAPFLMGCVQAGIDLNIVRLTYQRGVATSRLLPTTELTPLMRQPLLRSIGALTGIFYESVVVTEADSDRSFYDEINHRCLSSENANGVADCLFLNAQNWQTTAQIIGPLRRLGIAAASVVDLDILLEDKSEGFQALASAAGIPPATRAGLGQLRGQLHAIVKTKRESLKKIGVDCVSGDERRDLQSFVDQLAQYGVFLVPVGELEGWLPKLERGKWSSKIEWLLRTFEAMGDDAAEAAYVQPTVGDVWGFLGAIKSWLQNPSRLGMPAS